jgi:membrane protease subunit HflK
MANDPGWGNRNNGGPPDLDEVLRQFSRKLINLFGRPNKGGVQPPEPENKMFAVLPIVGLVALIWLSTGFYIVDQGSRGVVLRFGKHVDTTAEGPHWHMPYPIESVTVVNMQGVRTLEVGYRSGEGGTSRSKEPHESLMLTDDENIIDLQFAVQYNLKSVEDSLFSNRATEEAVRGVAETAIREVVGKSKMDFALYEGRGEVAARAKELMQQVLDRYKSGINIVNVTMQNAQPPEQVQAAFDDAVKAGQDLERQKNEGQAYANDVIPKARGNAARLLEEAAGYKLRVENEAKGNASRFEQVLTQYQRAPEVTRQRLYLDAQEQIMSSVSKVVVDQKGGNSLLYLPLDKLLATTGATVPNASSASQNLTSPVLPEADVNSQRSRDASRSRDREPR